MPPVKVKINSAFLQTLHGENEISKNNLKNKDAKRFQNQRNSPSWTQHLSHYFSEYCSASGIHGVRYLGERRRFVIEKLVWSAIITAMCFFCISLILKAYNKWITTPVMVTFATLETPIWDIPFPAVTICPEVRTDPKIFNYSDVFLRKLTKRDVTPEEERYFKSLSLICNSPLNITEVFQNGKLIVTKDAVEDIVNLRPVVSSKTTKVFWLGSECNFNTTMTETFTAEGLCYTFNMLDTTEIFSKPEDYVVKRSIKNQTSRRCFPTWDNGEVFPRSTFLWGSRGGFELQIYTNHSHLDYLCDGSLQGFKVVLHHPSSLPIMEKHFRLPLDQAVQVAISPRIMTVSEELKFYKPEARTCYFSTERRLAFFKFYDQQHCFLECLSNYTKERCGCVAFHMPKYDYWPICGPGSRDCLQFSRVFYVLNRSDFSMNGAGDYQNLRSSHCKCLPSCETLQYDVAISQTDWDWRKTLEMIKPFESDQNSSFDYEKGHLSKLAVFYKEIQFLSSERHEIYGYVDFFSNTGALLGLFIGFSVTSAIEILYFWTLRVACNIKKFGRVFWSGPRASED